MSEYDKGYAAGKSDAMNCFPAQASRLWKREFRNGYSDGYFAHSCQKKVY